MNMTNSKLKARIAAVKKKAANARKTLALYNKLREAEKGLDEASFLLAEAKNKDESRRVRGGPTWRRPEPEPENSAN